MAKNISQHKRMAMGDKAVGFAKGGSVTVPGLATSKVKVTSKATGLPESPITIAKRNNGIKGM